MNGEYDRPGPPPMGWDVLDAARRAWEWHGVACHVRAGDGEGSGVVGALDLPDHRHVEVFINDVDEDIWSTVDKWTVTENWTVRAVLPLQALGRAHEALRERGCELQGYWLKDDGHIAFGSVEIA